MLRRLGCLLALVALSLTQKTYENYKVYRLYPKTQEQVVVLHQMNRDYDFHFWKPPTSINRPVDLMVPPNKVTEFIRSMTLAGLKHEVSIFNVQSLIQKEELKPAVQVNAGFLSMDRYHTLDEIYSHLESLPRIFKQVQVVNPGNTSEGREIKGVIISYKKSNPGIFIEAGVHACEWIAPATALYLIEHLLTSEDRNVRNLAENYNWYIFPSFNPDGYVYSHTKDRLWRKTRSDHNSRCPGTDPNRNWGYKWMTGGSSNDPCNDTYAGPRAFSEPETFTMSKYIVSIRKKLFAYISFHSYSQYLVFPYACSSDHIDNYNDQLSIGKKAIAALEKRYGTKYTTDDLSETISSNVSGLSMDWVKALLKMPLVFLYEFRDTGKHGFLLPPNQIIPNGEEVLDSLIAMFQEAAQLGYPKK